MQNGLIIDVNDASVQGFGDPHGLALVTGEQSGGQAILITIGQRDGFFVGPEGQDWRHRPEYLIGVDRHFRGHANQHRGLEELPRTRSTGQQSGTGSQAIVQ
ncbi:hypothetical protein D3C78_1476720 [compost metagenome]